MPQLRQNVVTGEWVVIAPERSKRPSDFIQKEKPKPQLKESCPFCEGAAGHATRLLDYENESVYVMPNKFPAFLEDETKCSVRAYKLEDNFYTTRPASGGHDVLVVRDHDHQLYDFPVSTWRELFTLAGRRYHYWRNDCNTQYSMLIYNQGVAAGASIWHPHAQIFASNIIPNHISKELLGAQQYFENTGGCVYCDLLRHELKHQLRIVAENEKFVAFTFYAARFPFETWVMPKQHSVHFEEASNTLAEPLAEIMHELMAKLNRTLDAPPLNFFIHDLPTAVDDADYYHWHIEIAPRLSTYGGFELGSGTIIDVMAPEEAARFLQSEPLRQQDLA